MKKQLTIAEAKALIERKVGKTAPLSKSAAYFQNEAHINSRAYKLADLAEQGYITAEQAAKMKAGYIAQLQARYL